MIEYQSEDIVKYAHILFDSKEATKNPMFIFTNNQSNYLICDLLDDVHEVCTLRWMNMWIFVLHFNDHMAY